MKKIMYTWLLSAMFLTTINAQYGTERTGYEGDYFSLEGAIELFKESRSIRNFEKRLNQEDSWVNNLDLNYDGEIDYIRVEHRNQGDFHAIILQATLGRRDVQDVAVIEIEKTGRRSAVLQIIGDADLYGEEVIAEPYNSAGYSSRGDYDFNRGYVNVYHWRAVQHILGRSYVVYVSPYRWNYYPTYWNPWHQHGWSTYHPRRVRYYNHCHIVYIHRVSRVHNFYRPHRNYSHHVAQRTHQHRKKYGKSVAHRTQGKKQSTFRAPSNVRKGKVVAPRNSGGRKLSTQSGRSADVSSRNQNRKSTNIPRRSSSTTRSSSNTRTQERNKTISRNDNRNSNANRSSQTARRSTNSTNSRERGRLETQQRNKANRSADQKTQTRTQTTKSQHRNVEQRRSSRQPSTTSRSSSRSSSPPVRSQQKKSTSSVQKSKTTSSSNRQSSVKRSGSSKKMSSKSVRKGKGN